jgi:co-chaperonin GroES (HSP10)|tara:strand:+ start:700 stop:1086 length:387 start_codon:yes stop_codon:yes gene_type:complete
MTVEAVKGKELETEEPSVASQLPEPQGYKILIALPEAEEKSEGGIIMADITRRVEETASIIGFVIKMGPDCYKDEKRFPNGAYCKEGDFVIMRAYSGTRMKIHGKEFRIINDDTVEAVVQDPTGIVKA